MKNHTIKNIAWREIQKKLQVEREKPSKDFNGHGYFPFSNYISFLNELLGAEHYRIKCSSPQFITLYTHQVIVVSSATITIIDDEGDEITEVSANGAHEIRMQKSGEGFAALKAAAHNADCSAIKNALQLLGTFGYNSIQQEECDNEAQEYKLVYGEKIPQKDSNYSVQVANTSTSHDNSEIYNVCAIGAPYMITSPRGTPIWKIKTKEGYELTFFNNNMKKYAAVYNRFVMQMEGSNSKKVTVRATKTEYNNIPQLIVLDFIGKDGEILIK